MKKEIDIKGEKKNKNGTNAHFMVERFAYFPRKYAVKPWKKP